jgi:hypothetical protein
MKKYLQILFLILLIINNFLWAQETNSDRSDEYVTTPINISFVPSISIGDILTKETGKKLYVNGVSLSIIGGEAAKLSGIDVAGIFSIYTEDVKGVQGSGIFNEVKDNFQGVQAAGIFNHTGGDFKGVQGAGIFNSVEGVFNGVQGAYIFNSSMVFTGIQGASIFNRVENDFAGLQASGIFNAVDSDFIGLQSAGILNKVSGEFDGFQSAGIINVAESKFRGVQAAGIINVVKHLESGLQLGIINISEKNNGVPIGLISYVKNVPFNYDIWSDETLMLNVGIRSGNVKWYNLFLLGAQVHKDTKRYGLGIAFGRKFKIMESLNLDLGIQSHQLLRDSCCKDEINLLNKFMISFEYRIKSIKILTAPTLNVWISEEEEENFTPWTIYNEKHNRKYIRIWPGLILGLRF